MATFPKPLCELRVLLGLQGLHYRSRRRNSGGKALAGDGRPQRERKEDVPTCASTPQSQLETDVPGSRET